MRKAVGGAGGGAPMWRCQSPQSLDTALWHERGHPAHIGLAV